MRNIDPSSDENLKQSRENDAEVKRLQFLQANPHRCTQCGYPVGYIGRCACCVEDDAEFVSQHKPSEY